MEKQAKKGRKAYPERVVYPFQKAKFGIDFKGIFDRARSGDTENIMRSGSGRMLQYQCGERWLTVSDFRVPYFSMESILTDSDLSFTLVTRRLHHKEYWLTGGRHPDMFAPQFVGVALEYFRTKGTAIRCIRDEWDLHDSTLNGPTINVYMYERALAMGLSHDEAVRDTWSGRTYGYYGFTKYGDFERKVNSDGGDMISVVFYRDSSWLNL